MPDIVLATDAYTLRHRLAWTLAMGLVVVLAMGLRWYYVSTAMVYHPIRGDAIQYHAYAWNLAHYGIFSKALPGAAVVVADSYRDPGYPLFLAAWMRLLGNGAAWYAAVLLSQALLGALTVGVAMRIGRRWLSPAWTVVAGVLMAVWPHTITINGYVLSETLMMFLCASALWLSVIASERRSTWLMAAAGLVFSCAALTNAVLLPFALILAVLLAWRGHLTRRLLLALIIGSLVLPAGWAVRNMQLAPGSSSTDRALVNLVQGAWPAYHRAYIAAVNGHPNGRRVLDAINRETHLLERDPAQGAQAIAHRFAQAPGHYLAWYVLRKPVLLWGWRIRIGQGDIYVYPTFNSPFNTQVVWRVIAALCHALNRPIMLLMLMGILLAACVRGTAPVTALGEMDAKPRRMALDASAILVLYVTAIYTLLQAEPRYSIAFRPYEMLLAVTAMGWATAWLRRVRQRKLPSAPDSREAEIGEAFVKTDVLRHMMTLNGQLKRIDSGLSKKS